MNAIESMIREMEEENRDENENRERKQD